MKKTLLALSVLAAAGSVNAAEVYNNNGVSVELSGAGEVQFYQNYEADGTDVSQEIRIDDAQVNVRVGVEISEGLTAIAGLDQTFESDDSDGEGSVSTDGTYVGFATTDMGTVTFGRQYLITDDSGIGTDFEVGAGQYGQDVTVGNDVIKYVYDNGQYYFGISHDLDEGDSADSSDANSTDGRLGFRTGGLDARLYIYSGESVSLGSNSNGDTLGTGDEDSYNLEAVYTFNDQWEVAGSFGHVDQDSGNTEVSDKNIYELTGTYTQDKNAFSLGYVYTDEDASYSATSVSDTRGETNNLYGVVTHTFNSNVRAYAELGYYDVDYDTTADLDYEMAYTVGMEVKF